MDMDSPWSDRDSCSAIESRAVSLIYGSSILMQETAVQRSNQVQRGREGTAILVSGGLQPEDLEIVGRSSMHAPVFLVRSEECEQYLL
jgi:hypothetical protein